jgi:hypothetical protein
MYNRIDLLPVLLRFFYLIGVLYDLLSGHSVIHVYPILQFVPSEYTGTWLAPPPATIEAKVVAVAFDTNVLAPAPEVTALGNVATV